MARSEVPCQLSSVRPMPPAVHGARVCSAITLLAASAFAVPRSEMWSATRGCSDVAFARQAAMYLAHVTAGLNFTEVGRSFGRDRTTAAHACRLVEERRENPRIDALFCALEAACARLLTPDAEHGPAPRVLHQTQDGGRS